jgi:LacI family transcriptional regulator
VARIPTVFINRRVKVSGANWVGPDDVYGGYQATEHLIGHGHRRIAHIGGLEGWVATEERLLDLPEPPPAVFVANDRMASGVLEVARRRGASVPDGLAVVGYDGRELGRYLTPQLTTVALPLYQMGVVAAMVVDHILRPRPEARTAAVRGHLVYRASCGRHSLTAEAPEDRRPTPGVVRARRARRRHARPRSGAGAGRLG